MTTSVVTPRTIGNMNALDWDHHAYYHRLVLRHLPRPLHELPAELTAAIGHRLRGTAFAILRASGRGRWYAKELNHTIMPVVLDPSLATRQVRQQASALLPGTQVRRLVFWRYFLLWRKPIET